MTSTIRVIPLWCELEHRSRDEKELTSPSGFGVSQLLRDYKKKLPPDGKAEWPKSVEIFDSQCNVYTEGVFFRTAVTADVVFLGPILVTLVLDGFETLRWSKQIPLNEFNLNNLKALIPNLLTSLSIPLILDETRNCRLVYRTLKSSIEEDVTDESLKADFERDHRYYVQILPATQISLCTLDLFGFLKPFFTDPTIPDLNNHISQVARVLKTTSSDTRIERGPENSFRVIAKQITVFEIDGLPTQKFFLSNEKEIQKYLQREFLFFPPSSSPSVRWEPGVGNRKVLKITNSKMVAFMLPTGAKINVHFPKASASSVYHNFVEEYLKAKCGCPREFTLVEMGKDDVAIKLAPLNESPPNGGFIIENDVPKLRLIIESPDGRKEVWAWSPDTPYIEVFRDATVLLQLNANDVEPDIPPTLVTFGERKFAGQLEGLEGFLRLKQKDRLYTGSVIFQGQPFKPDRLSQSASVYVLKSKLFADFATLVPSKAPEDIIISNSIEGEPLDDRILLKDVPAQLFARVNLECEVPFQYQDRIFTERFPPTVKIAEVKEKLAQRLEARISEIELFFAGKELSEELEIGNLRVRPPAFVLVVTVSYDPFLLESIAALREQPSPYTFVRADGEEFQMSFLSGDFIDRVRICVADKLDKAVEDITIWQNNQMLDDDVILSNLGENRKLDVVVNVGASKSSALMKIRCSLIMGKDKFQSLFSTFHAASEPAEGGGEEESDEAPTAKDTVPVTLEPEKRATFKDPMYTPEDHQQVSALTQIYAPNLVKEAFLRAGRDWRKAKVLLQDEVRRSLTQSVKLV